MICLYIKSRLFDTIIEILDCRVLFWVGLSSKEYDGFDYGDDRLTWGMGGWGGGGYLVEWEGKQP